MFVVQTIMPLAKNARPFFCPDDICIVAFTTYLYFQARVHSDGTVWHGSMAGVVRIVVESCLVAVLPLFILLSGCGYRISFCLLLPFVIAFVGCTKAGHQVLAVGEGIQSIAQCQVI